VTDTPIYLTHTSLTNDFSSIGTLPYRFVVLQLSESFSMSLLCDTSLDLTELYKVIMLSNLFSISKMQLHSRSLNTSQQLHHNMKLIFFQIFSCKDFQSRQRTWSLKMSEVGTFSIIKHMFKSLKTPKKPKKI
jgi:hypothetical protein